MSHYLLHGYLPAFATAVFAEMGVAILFGLWTLRQLGAVALVNCLTHPALHALLWVGYWRRGASLSGWDVFGFELAVVLVEGALLRSWLRLPARKAFLLSTVMNSASYLIGLGISHS